MSEFTTNDANAAVLLDLYGLDITTSKKVTVTTPDKPKPKTPKGTVLVEGSKANDKVTAFGSFDYTIEGRGGNDKLRGGKQDDTIVGGAGKDVAIGGKGKDIFEFSNGDLVESNRAKKLDTINDLGKGDLIRLDKKIVDKNLKAGALDPDDLAVVKKNSSKIDATLIFVKSEGVLYYNDDEKTKDTKLMNIDGVNPQADNFEIF